MVACRIPNAIVDSVENSDRRSQATPHHAFQSVTELRALLNLDSVSLAHRCDGIRENHANLHEIQHSIEFKGTQRKELSRIEPRTRHCVRRKDALISHVVDGENRARAGQGRVPSVKPLQVSSSQSCLMIVTMQN